MPSKHWEPGNAAYKDFLDKLSPDERKEHFDKRKNKVALNKAMQSVIQQQHLKWLVKLNLAHMAIMEQAIGGDVAAYKAITDIFIGKPDTKITIDTEQILPWSDNFDEE